jgi:hypothetical protein
LGDETLPTLVTVEGEGEEQPDSVYLPAIRFTPADLVANRRGELTVDQQIRLGEIAVGRTRGAAQTAKWGALMIAALLGVGVVIEARKGEAPIGAYLVVAGLGLFFAAAIAVTYRGSRGLKNWNVSTAEGQAEAVVEERAIGQGGRYTAYELQVRGGRHRWAFTFADQASLDAVPTGGWLRVYFLANQPFSIILSYEAWDEGRPAG